jgi:seryl-tRNA synthetase
MLDRRLFLEQFDQVARRLARKGVSADDCREARDALLKQRELTREIEQLRAARRKASDEIGALVRSGSAERAEEAKRAFAEGAQRLEAIERDVKRVDEEVEKIMLCLPNPPSDQAPEGMSESSNVVVRTSDYDPKRFEGVTYRPHWDVATALGMYDAERAAKLSGAMFAVLRGNGARLLRALVRWALELNSPTYEEILAPHFVRTDVFTGTGHLPKFEMEAYKLRDDDLWVIPTGEVPLMGLHREEILSVEELPRRYMTYSACFRREAGSAGKDTRGMQRLHEFHKVELLKLCSPDQVEAEFAGLLADAERPLKLLGLPYRVVDLCCGDLTFSSARVFDLEVYAPGVERWLEVSSVGMFTDFQARRSNIRFRRERQKPEYVHSMNASALATPRVWAAILEHGQQPDGSVRIPPVLVPYFGAETIEAPRV